MKFLVLNKASGDEMYLEPKCQGKCFTYKYEPCRTDVCRRRMGCSHAYFDPGY